MDYARAAVAGVLSAGIIVAIVNENAWTPEAAIGVGVVLLILLVPDVLRAYHQHKNRNKEDD